MLTKAILKKEYGKNKRIIRERLKEFSESSKNKNDNDIFLELCFCLCTPQSKAVKVAEVIHAKNMNKLLNAKHEELSAMLRQNIRFHINKAKYIIEARKHITALKLLSKNALDAREFLVNNVKGLGYKEASHFLRNIGRRNICIIDRHVINLMHELRVFKSNNPPKNPKEYLKMEDIIKDFAKEINIDVDELDLLLWSTKTGIVFK